jgi:hypothetical protein
MEAKKIKLRYVLPSAQMVLAWMLLHQLPFSECDVPEPSPQFEIFFAINAPLALLRPFWTVSPPGIWGGDRYLWSPSLGALVAIPAVGLLWYLVALNHRALRQRGVLLTFKWRPARFVLDGLLIVLGIMLGLMGILYARQFVRSLGWVMPLIHGRGCYGPVWLELLSSVAVGCALLGWCFVLLLIYGRDFTHCAHRTAAR